MFKFILDKVIDGPGYRENNSHQIIGSASVSLDMHKSKAVAVGLKLWLHKSFTISETQWLYGFLTFAIGMF